MRKAILVMMVLAATLFAVSSVFALQTDVKTYTVHLGTSDTGVTTTAKTGTNALVLDGQDFKRADGLTTLNDLSYMQSGNGVLWIRNIVGSQVQQKAGGDYSGNTFYVAAKSIGPNGDFAKAELIPITPVMAMNSGLTPFGLPFQLPAGKKTRIYLVSTGVTPYGVFTADMELGLAAGSAWLPPAPILINTLAFTGPTSSGGSPFTSVPDGTDSLVMFQNSVAGVTAMVQPTSSPSLTGEYVAANEWFTVTETLPGLRAYYVRMLGVGTLTVKCNTAKPY